MGRGAWVRMGPRAPLQGQTGLASSASGKKRALTGPNAGPQARKIGHVRGCTLVALGCIRPLNLTAPSRGALWGRSLGPASCRSPKMQALLPSQEKGGLRPCHVLPRLQAPTTCPHLPDIVGVGSYTARRASSRVQPRPTAKHTHSQQSTKQQDKPSSNNTPHCCGLPRL